MGVYENKQRPGTWIAELRVDGVRVGRKTAYTKEEAKDVYADMRTKYRAGIGVGADGERTVGQAIDYWLTYVSARKSDRTHAWEQTMLANIGQQLRAVRLDDKDLPFKVTRELSRLAERPARKRKGRGGTQQALSLNTIGRVRDLLRQVFRKAQANGWLPWNPAELADLPPARTAPQRRYSHVALSEKDLERLKTHARTEDTQRGAMAYVQVRLGLRSGEVRGLAWREVDLKSGLCSIVAQADPDGELGPTKGDGASDRTWTLPDEVVEVLRAQEQRQRERKMKRRDVWEDSGLVFTNDLGAAVDPSNWRRDLEGLCKAAGVPKVSPTDLRRTFATDQKRSGARKEDVADAMGHSTTRMLDKHYYVKERRPITLLTEAEGG